MLYPFNQKEVDFVIATPSTMLGVLSSLHGKRSSVQSYVWVPRSKRCWETRGLSRKEILRCVMRALARRLYPLLIAGITAAATLDLT